MPFVCFGASKKNVCRLGKCAKREKLRLITILLLNDCHFYECHGPGLNFDKSLKGQGHEI